MKPTGVLGSEIAAEIGKYGVDPVFIVSKDKGGGVTMTIEDPAFNDLAEAIWEIAVINRKQASLETCQACGEEIYPGEYVYIVDGYILHNNWECLAWYINPEVKTIEEALEIEEQLNRIEDKDWTEELNHDD